MHIKLFSFSLVPPNTDPNAAASTNPLTISQIGRKTLKASWQNKNGDTLSYNLTYDGRTDSVSCEAKQECITYLRLDASQGPVTVVFTETNEKIIQEVTVEVPVSADIPS